MRWRCPPESWDGIAIAEPVQLHQLQKLIYFLPDYFLRRSQAARANPQAESDILEDRHVPKQRVVLKDKADPAVAEAGSRSVVVMNQDRAVVIVRDFDSRNDSQERGLAGAGRPEQRDQLAGFDLKAHVFERCEVAKSFY